MLRIWLDAEDLGRIRFADAPAPVLETALMLFELRRSHAPHSAWRDQVLREFPAEARPLHDLVRPTRAVYFLDVLASDVGYAFELVQATPTADLSQDVDFVWPGPRPAWLGQLARGTAEARDTVVRALRACHTTCVAPLWPAVVTRFEADIADRMTLARRQGIAAALGSLGPDICLHGNVIEVWSLLDQDIRACGRGVVLVPTAFWTGPPLVTWDREDRGQCVIIYPARVRDGTADGAGDVLGALLGATRAEVLRALVAPLTTTDLAKQVWISVPSASQHASTLRNAGLITSQRNGKIVEHRITGLGLSLVRVAPFGSA